MVEKKFDVTNWSKFLSEVADNKKILVNIWAAGNALENVTNEIQKLNGVLGTMHGSANVSGASLNLLTDWTTDQAKINLKKIRLIDGVEEASARILVG